MNTDGSATNIIESQERFFEARRKALREDLVARLRRRTDDLLPYEKLAEILQVYQQIPPRGAEMIPLDRIVGSVGRYRDFTRSFLPRENVRPERWVRVDRAMGSMVGVPPIEVFKVGSVYFVADGNHRVSVARANGFNEIAAYVTEIPVDAELEPGDTLDQAIVKAERAHFLAQTNLVQYFSGLEDIRFTEPNGFQRVLDQIEAHRCTLAEGRPEGKEVTFEEAALDWYMQVYLPIVAAIRRQKLLGRFPGRTPADLYIWASERALELERAYGSSVSPDEAVAGLQGPAETPFRRAVRDVMRTLTDLAAEVAGVADMVPEWVSMPFEWGDYQPTRAIRSLYPDGSERTDSAAAPGEPTEEQDSDGRRG